MGHIRKISSKYRELEFYFVFIIIRYCHAERVRKVALVCQMGKHMCRYTIKLVHLHEALWQTVSGLRKSGGSEWLVTSQELAKIEGHDLYTCCFTF
jgi:hypothetical protein